MGHERSRRPVVRRRGEKAVGEAPAVAGEAAVGADVSAATESRGPAGEAAGEAVEVVMVMAVGG